MQSIIARACVCLCVCVRVSVFKQAASTASGYGVRVNVLCPGFVETDLFSAVKTNLGRFSHMGDATEQLMQHLGVIRSVWAGALRRWNEDAELRDQKTLVFISVHQP